MEHACNGELYQARVPHSLCRLGSCVTNGQTVESNGHTEYCTYSYIPICYDTVVDKVCVIRSNIWIAHVSCKWFTMLRANKNEEIVFYLFHVHECNQYNSGSIFYGRSTIWVVILCNFKIIYFVSEKRRIIVKNWIKSRCR